MKKNIRNMAVIALTSVFFLSSCATILGGKITDYQKTKPAEGEPARPVRVVALVADLFFMPALIIDFATNAIYKPEKK